MTAAGFEPSLYHWKSPASLANAQAIELRSTLLYEIGGSLKVGRWYSNDEKVGC